MGCCPVSEGGSAARPRAELPGPWPCLVIFLLMAGTGFSQSFTGFIDGSYGYNFNKPGDAKSLYRNFDVNHNQFSLNYAELAIEQKPAPLGFRADIGFGDAATIVHAGEPAGADIYRPLQQAYVSAAKGKVQVDFGKFVTQHGAEVIETKDNWNYSRSLLFAWAIPYYHFGARLTVTANDRVTLGASVSNGWNNVVDNNQGKTVGFQAVLRPTSKFSFVQNYMVGKEQSGVNVDAVRHLWDSLATLDVTPRLSLMANYDYGMDRSGGARVRWQGLAGYAKISPTSKLKLIPRLEWFDDSQGFTTGTAQTLKEGTLTAEILVAEGAFLRGEYRYDWSNQSVFQRNATGALGHQSSVTLGFVYTYSKAK